MDKLDQDLSQSVQVLMSTYNGERFVEEQIESILAQRGVRLSILARDDGSSDSTLAILERYRSNNFEYYTGENLGPCNSFFDLVSRSSEGFGFFAFSDQDDYWLEDKLEVAVQSLLPYSDRPAMYCSTTTLVDEHLQYIGEQEHMPARNLGQALVHAQCTGCTMVFNSLLRDLIIDGLPVEAAMHDAWIMRVCYALGGTVIVDGHSHILYRQHGSNVVGGRESFSHKWKRRIENGFVSRKRVRSSMSAAIMSRYYDILPTSSLRLLTEVSDYRHGLNRFTVLCDKRLLANGAMRNAMFITSVLIGAF